MHRSKRATDDLATVTGALAPPWRGVFFDAVGSTQDEARAAAGRGAPSRSVFVADYQRAGRGRQGRTWLASPGSGLLVSILFREASRKPMPLRWTSLAALALLEAIDGLAPRAPAAIKWPNDVLIADRKVAGVLAESAWNGQEVTTIVGVGLNVHAAQPDLDAFHATSLDAACGRRVERGALLRGLVDGMDAWLARSDDERREAWHRRLWGRGQRLRMVDVGVDQEVVVLGVEADGALRVRLDDGTERVTTTAELIL